MRPRWRTFFPHTKRHELFARPVFFRFHEHIAPDEVRLCKIDECPQPSLNWISLGRQIRAVQGITHFEPQGVTCSEAARFDSELFASLQNELPKVRPVFAAKERFETVFSSVTSPCDCHRHTLDYPIHNMIARRKIDI